MRTDLTKDKRNVAASLRQSAGHSRVTIPRGWDFNRNLNLVSAHLDAQARYRSR